MTASTRLLALALLGLAACPPPTVRTTPLEATLTALPPTMAVAPTHRGEIDMTVGVAGQSYVGRTSARPSGLSQYARPYTGGLSIGGRFSRFVGARLIGELGLGGERVDAYGAGLLASGLPGRLGGSLDLGYTSEAVPVHASLSIEAGMHVTVMHRIFEVDTRTCAGLTEDTCTPWRASSFPSFSGIEIVPYLRVTGLLGYTIVPALRVLVQGSIATTPRLEGSGAAPTITQAPAVGVEGGLEVSYDGVSLLVTGGWSSADVFEYGPRAGMVLRGQFGDGPGSEERVRAARCHEIELRRRRDGSLQRAFFPREDSASAYSPTLAVHETGDPCPSTE